MEDANKTFLPTSTTNVKIKRITSKLISIAIQLGCFLFVFSQTYQCIKKFVNDPQGTDIRIVEGTKDTYPDITICTLEEAGYESVLENCNLTYNAYFIDGIWIGHGSQEYCSKPDQLFNEMTKPAYQDFSMTYIDFDDPNNYYAEEFTNKDWDEFGRCKTFQYPDHVEKGLWMLHLETKASTYQVILSTPGYFVSPEYHSVLLEPDYDTKIKVTREVVQVLNYEGQPCNPTFTRDDCVYDYIFQNLTKTIGCTTPFLNDKSRICTQQSKAVKAMDIESEIILNRRYLNKICPRSCVEVHANFGSVEKYHAEESTEYFVKGNLTLDFHQFVKISTSFWAYDEIELIAEVGGYVGLFLGVSVNQVRFLIGRLFSL